MAKYPVVVYGASGYTGMLTMDWLIDQNIPFTAVARNAKRTQEGNCAYSPDVSKFCFWYALRKDRISNSESGRSAITA